MTLVIKIPMALFSYWLFITPGGLLWDTEEHWPRKEEKCFRDALSERSSPLHVYSEFALAFLDALSSRSWDKSRKTSRNNYFHEANGNHIQIQEKKNETGKGGSHFLRKSCGILVILCWWKKLTAHQLCPRNGALLVCIFGLSKAGPAA